MLVEDLKKILSEADHSKTFANFIAEKFDNKMIEIYTGDDYNIVSVEQESFTNRSVFCGRVMGSIKNYIVIDCFSEANGKISTGNLMFINSDMIVALKLLNTRLPMKNTFIKSGSGVQGSLDKEININSNESVNIKKKTGK